MKRRDLRGKCRPQKIERRLFAITTRLVAYLGLALLAISLLWGIDSKIANFCLTEDVMRTNYGEDWRAVMLGAAVTNRLQFERMGITLRNINGDKIETQIEPCPPTLNAPEPICTEK